MRLTDSAIELASMFFGAGMVVDATNNPPTGYRFAALTVLATLVVARSIMQGKTWRRNREEIALEIIAMISLGLSSWCVSIAIDGYQAYGPVSWIVGGPFITLFLLIAHALRHTQDWKLCAWLCAGILALLGATVLVGLVVVHAHH